MVARKPSIKKAVEKALPYLSAADAASDSSEFERAIDLYKLALAALPDDKKLLEFRSEILKEIGHCYHDLDDNEECEKFLNEAGRCLVASPAFKSVKKKLETYLDKPLDELPFRVTELGPAQNEPYKGLLVPDALPMLQHTVYMLRPYGINLHAWMYECVVALQEDLEGNGHQYLPSLMPESEIKRLRKARKYDPDEAVMLRGTDGCVYKLVAPGKLTKTKSAGGSSCKS